jgi:hypothetical protein
MARAAVRKTTTAPQCKNWAVIEIGINTNRPKKIRFLIDIEFD